MYGVILRVFQRIYLIGFANKVFKERQYKGYCLISNRDDCWKFALDYCIYVLLLLFYTILF